MLVSVACSQRSCQAKPFWGFETSRSCFFCPMWEVVRAQFKAPKLYIPPGNHSAMTLLSICRSHVSSSRMKDSTRTYKGQSDSWHLSSKITVLFSLLCDVWGLSQLTLQISALSDWKGEGEFVCSSWCQFFLELFCMWFISCGMLREPCQAAQWGAPWREDEPGKGFLWRKQRLREYLSGFKHDWVHEKVSPIATSRSQDEVMRQQNTAAGKEKISLWRDLSWSDHSGYCIFPLPFYGSSWLPWGCLQRVTHVCWALITGHKMCPPGCSTSKMHIQKVKCPLVWFLLWFSQMFSWQ